MICGRAAPARRRWRSVASGSSPSRIVEGNRDGSITGLLRRACPGIDEVMVRPGDVCDRRRPNIKGPLGALEAVGGAASARPAGVDGRRVFAPPRSVPSIFCGSGGCVHRPDQFSRRVFANSARAMALRRQPCSAGKAHLGSTTPTVLDPRSSQRAGMRRHRN